ncbi:unnamed protein product [Caenorhabditis angaria]|uniref:Uncharacterized protein n=1 Tax=Caenorhabditis angaria TaxID=860376 RepID=A0A9P1J6E0_9PELO|nr:unnamed protein product [Caenorhabditis angaria]
MSQKRARSYDHTSSSDENVIYAGTYDPDIQVIGGSSAEFRRARARQERRHARKVAKREEKRARQNESSSTSSQGSSSGIQYSGAVGADDDVQELKVESGPPDAQAGFETKMSKGTAGQEGSSTSSQAAQDVKAHKARPGEERSEETSKFSKQSGKADNSSGSGSRETASCSENSPTFKKNLEHQHEEKPIAFNFAQVVAGQEGYSTTSQAADQDVMIFKTRTEEKRSEETSKVGKQSRKGDDSSGSGFRELSGCSENAPTLKKNLEHQHEEKPITFNFAQQQVQGATASVIEKPIKLEVENVEVGGNSNNVLETKPQIEQQIVGTSSGKPTGGTVTGEHCEEASEVKPIPEASRTSDETQNDLEVKPGTSSNL